MQSIWQRFAILLRQKKEGMYTKLDFVCVCVCETDVRK